MPRKVLLQIYIFLGRSWNNHTCLESHLLHGVAVLLYGTNVEMQIQNFNNSSSVFATVTFRQKPSPSYTFLWTQRNEIFLSNIPALNILYLYKYINKSVLSLETPMFAAPSTSSDQRPPPPTNILTTSFHHNAPDALNMPVRTSIEIHHNAPDAQSTTSVHEFTYHEEEDAKKAKKKRK